MLMLPTTTIGLPLLTMRAILQEGVERRLPARDIQGPADSRPHLSLPCPFPEAPVSLVLCNSQAVHNRHTPRQITHRFNIDVMHARSRAQFRVKCDRHSYWIRQRNAVVSGL